MKFNVGQGGSRFKFDDEGEYETSSINREKKDIFTFRYFNGTISIK
ncbi:hypothetical protein [Sporanaerobacter acetigenes]|nr:hypothetical protein [Sporanaerobacter acetigenes]